MKTISIFTASMGKGGSERVLSLLTKEMAIHGDNVTIYQLIDPTVAYELHHRVKVKYLRKYNFRLLNLFYWLISIRRIVKESDVVISFAYKINIMVFISKIGLRHPRIIFSERNHPRYDGRSFMGFMICNFIYKRVHRLVVQNRSIQQSFSQRVVENSVIIPNPIERVLDFEYQVDSNRITAVGRLVPQKNFNFLIEAFSHVIKELPKLKLFIYGEGLLRVSLEQQILTLGLSDHVFLPGVVDNIFEELSQSALFVQTSLYEGQSNSLLEAMACGIPPVVLYYDGLEEILNNRTNGFILQTEQPVKFAEEVISIIREKNNLIKVNHELGVVNVAVSTLAYYYMWEKLF
jgi:glycosyltransferase involved in cell wall biosynthesis